MITLLDYGAGNVRSVRNAIRRLGYDVRDVSSPEDVVKADKLIFPGVGSFGSAMEMLYKNGYVEVLKKYIEEGRPFLGICLGLQTLFEGSEESPGVPGLGVIKGWVKSFDDHSLSVPHIGWNGVKQSKASRLFSGYNGEKLYFVHSYHPVPDERDSEWILTTTDYGGEFVSGVQRGNVSAVQFHPEKSGPAGLRILQNFLASDNIRSDSVDFKLSEKTRFAKRIVACLDVRTNDEGDLVVTKGHRYDVRQKGSVRNLGEPVELAKRYFEEGADEICFLNITGFRDFPLKDMPMLEVLRKTSENVFVPLTIGGGIREYTDSDGRKYSALDVASEYFRSGADKISIGSDAVYAAEQLLHTGEKTGKSSIEQISRVYGRQAVVVSIDPRRIYVRSPDEVKHHTIKTSIPGPDREEYCWYQCTVKGGREGRDIDAFQLAKACQELGAGEILLNCMDRDGTNLGYDTELIHDITHAVRIPVIASSGAGCVEHFYDVFIKTDVEAALAAGIFHRREVPIQTVKDYLRRRGIEVR
ncbi:MAG: imidazole glycerol phosphate synthase subunit HisF [Nitrososphaeria archaeon]|nr:imidazole glycerol phosphate synthase subunit HisF [Nitrososphaeria archaeon]NIN53420.1 imidazole glycerol phosphate synthase subunit HisF [Nitrososphaeria archaeon]NIQ33935.1 imidazole glycerol phosphate synthase subunit HisF [Nitrososphaeria archaeon]